MRKFIIFISIIFCSLFTESARVFYVKGAIFAANFFAANLNISAENISSKNIKALACEKLAIKLNKGPKISITNPQLKIGNILFLSARSLDIDLNDIKSDLAKDKKTKSYQDYAIVADIKKYHQFIYYLHEKINIIIPKIQIKYSHKIFEGAVNFEHVPFEKNLSRSYINFSEEKNFSINYQSTYHTKVNKDFSLKFDLNLNHLDNKIKVNAFYETNYKSNNFNFKNFDIFHNGEKIVQGNIDFLEKKLNANINFKNVNINNLLGNSHSKQIGWILNANLKHEGLLNIANLSGEINAQYNKLKYLFKLGSANKKDLDINAFLNKNNIGTILLNINEKQIGILAKLKDFHDLLNNFLKAKSSSLESSIKYNLTNNKFLIEKCTLILGNFKINSLDFMSLNKFTADLTNEDNQFKLNASIENLNHTLKLSGTSYVVNDVWKHDYLLNSAKFMLTDMNNINIPIQGELKFFGENNDLSLTGDVGINSGKIKKMDLLNFSSIPKIKVENTEKEESTSFKVNTNITIKINENFTIESKNFIAVLKGKALLTGNLFSPEITSEIFISDGYFNIINKKFEFKKSQIFTANNNIYLLMTAHYSDSEYEFIIEISGQLGQNLTIDFSSIPSMPKSKIIPRIILGDKLNKISPFEAIMLVKKFLNIESDKDIDDYLKIFNLEDFKVIQENGNVKVKLSKKIVEDVILSVEGGATEKAEKVIAIEKIFSEKLSSYLKSSTKNSAIFGAKLKKFYD